MACLLPVAEGTYMVISVKKHIKGKIPNHWIEKKKV
jgi:hypothetical protein